VAIAVVLVASVAAQAQVRCESVFNPRTLSAEVDALAGRLNGLNFFALAHKLEGVRHPKIDQFLREFLANPASSGPLRAQALEILKGRQDENFFDLLTLASRDTSMEVRESVLKLLKGQRSEAADRLIQEGLRDANPRVSSAALDALKGRQDPVSLQMLAEVLTNGDAYQRRTVIEFILPLRRDVGAVRLFDLALSERNRDDMDLASRALEKHNGDLRSLLLLENMLNSPNENTRLIAVIELQARTKLNQFVHELVGKAFLDASDRVRVRSVGLLNPNLPEHKIYFDYAQADSHPSVRQAAAFAVSSGGVLREAVLTKALEDRHQLVRLEAVRALVKFEDAAAAPLLHKAFHDIDSMVQREAAAAVVSHRERKTAAYEALTVLLQQR